MDGNIMEENEVVALGPKEYDPPPKVMENGYIANGLSKVRLMLHIDFAQ
jgi:hypothetical protein